MNLKLISHCLDQGRDHQTIKLACGVQLVKEHEVLSEVDHKSNPFRVRAHKTVPKLHLGIIFEKQHITRPALK